MNRLAKWLLPDKALSWGYVTEYPSGTARSGASWHYDEDKLAAYTITDLHGRWLHVTPRLRVALGWRDD